MIKPTNKFYCIACFPEGCTCGAAYRRWDCDDLLKFIIKLTYIAEEKANEIKGSQ